MNDMDQPDPLGEDILRRALRLEVDERPPRLDAVAIAVAARRRTVQERVFRAGRGLMLVGAAAAFELLVALVAFSVLTEGDGAAPFGVILSITASVAERALALGSITASPTVGLASLATILFATLYERTGRESDRVTTS